MIITSAKNPHLIPVDAEVAVDLIASPVFVTAFPIECPTSDVAPEAAFDTERVAAPREKVLKIFLVAAQTVPAKEAC